MVARLQLAFVEAVVELARGGGSQGVAVVAIVDEHALRVGRPLRIEESEEERRINVVVGADDPSIGAYLPEQARLEESPGGHQRVDVAQRSPQPERRRHVAFDVDVAGNVGVGEAAFVRGG